MVIEELKQKVNKGILDLGITPSFTENPSFHNIIDNVFNPLIERIETNENSTPQVDINGDYIKIEDNYTVNAFGNNINKSVSFKVKKNSDSSFYCVCEILKSIPESVSRKVKEVFKVTVKIDFDGNIYTTEVYSTAKETANPSVLEGNTICQNTIYDGNGIMMKKEKKSYNGLKYKSNIQFISAQEMLYISDRAFDMQSSFYFKYNRRESLVRDAFDVAELSIDDQENYSQYIGYVLLDDSQGLSDMNPINNSNDSDEEKIEPLTIEEIRAKINKETDSVIRAGLYEYAKDRNKIVYQNGLKQDALTPNVKRF